MILSLSMGAGAAKAQELGRSEGGGGVSGTVKFAGEYRQPAPLKVVKNRDVCGLTVPNETFRVGPDGGIDNAVVTLRPLGRSVAVKPGRNILDNKQCAFVPHVQVATVGSELLLKNSDPILHTVHARLDKKTLFHVGLPQWRQVSKRLSQPGILRIDCDVLHTWMSAAVVVVTTPYYHVTDPTGVFSFDSLEAGPYGIEVWHERLGIRTGKILVTAGKAVSLEVVYANAAK